MFLKNSRPLLAQVFRGYGICGFLEGSQEIFLIWSKKSCFSNTALTTARLKSPNKHQCNWNPEEGFEDGKVSLSNKQVNTKKEKHSLIWVN